MTIDPVKTIVLLGSLAFCVAVWAAVILAILGMFG